MQHDDWAARRDPLLDRVYARGQELRRRRQTAMGFIATAIVILIAVPAVALSGSGGSHSKVNTIGAPTTPSSDDTTTAPVAGVVTPASDAPSSTASPTTTAHAATTTTTLVCRNSTNPACGPFYWDPAPPPNQPLTVQVTYSPTNPRPGETVHFYPVADDPDAAFITQTSCIDYGDGHPCPPVSSNPPAELPGSPPPPHAYGPWTPPAPEHGHCPGADPHPAECQFFFAGDSSRDATGACSSDHIFASAGTYTVKMPYHSFTRPSGWARPGYPGLPMGVQGLTDPYTSSFTASVTVTVSGTAVTTTTAPGPRTNSNSDC